VPVSVPTPTPTPEPVLTKDHADAGSEVSDSKRSKSHHKKKSSEKKHQHKKKKKHTHCRKSKENNEVTHEIPLPQPELDIVDNVVISSKNDESDVDVITNGLSSDSGDECHVLPHSNPKLPSLFLEPVKSLSKKFDFYQSFMNPLLPEDDVSVSSVDLDEVDDSVKIDDVALTGKAVDFLRTNGAHVIFNEAKRRSRTFSSTKNRLHTSSSSKKFNIRQDPDPDFIG